jgi:uncharacterized protein (TIGR02594 family)
MMEPWLSTAYDEMAKGVAEIPGDEHHESVLVYHSYTTLKASSDEVPWCSAFICYCFETNHITSTKSAAARSWLKWGKEILYPEHGAVVVMWRKQKDGPMGHVGLYVGEKDGMIKVLSGNQKNSVSIQLYPKHRVLSYRWPNA